MLERKKIELLIPVGGTMQLIAAVENGADAVYLGGTAFNARMSADNFDIEKMEQAVDFCHVRGVRVFVTLNTLMRDEQLEKGLEYAKKLYEIGVDALIIQDLGFGDLISENLPDMELHLSTQGTIFGEGGAQAAKLLGYTRVVLAREMPLDLIEKVSKNSQIETEVFVHGALCFCFSGQCQLSRTIGGRSGNQGVCAQPCRLPYRLDGNAPRYELSPKDLCLVDYLGDLIKAGVTSLKVEGRLKSPEYVATVTKIYRKYIDEFYEKGAYQVSTEDRMSLLQIFNRGSFTEGYINNESGDELMSKAFPKNQGIFLGSVKGISKIRDRYVVEIDSVNLESTKQLSVGDIIEARFYDPSGNLFTQSATLTYLKGKVKSGTESLSLGDFLSPVPKDAEIYRVVSKKLNEEAAETYKDITLVSGKYKRTTPVDMKLKCHGKVVTLEAYSKLLGQCISESINIEGSQDPRENLDKIRENLGKLGGTPFHKGTIEIQPPIPMGLKISQVNGLRREIVGKLESAIVAKDKRRLVEDRGIAEYKGTTLEKKKYHLLKSNKSEVYFYSIKDFEKEIENPQLHLESQRTVALLPLADILLHEISPEALTEKTKERGYKDWIPYISNVSMGREDEIIWERFEEAVRIGRDRGIYLGNLQWFEELKNAGCKIYGDFGMNAYNSGTAKLLEKMGFDEVVPSSETYGDENGAYPLMTFQHKISGASMRDRRGMRISIVEREWSDQRVLVKDGIKWDKVSIDRRVFFAG